MKYYLLIAGDNYYPGYATSDWKRCFTSYEEAKAMVSEAVDPPETFSKGPRKGQPKPNQRIKRHYYINNEKYDWYEIVDLEKWVNEQ